MLQTNHSVPSGSFAETETYDEVAHARCLTGWQDVRYEHVSRQPFRGHVSELNLWPVQIILERVDQPCIYRGACWEGGVTFMSMLDADGEVFCDGRRVNESTVTISPTCAASVFLRKPTYHLGITVDEHALIEHGRRVLRKDLSIASLGRNAAINDAAIVAVFQNCAMLLFDEIKAQPGLLRQDVYLESARARVLDMLVQVLDAGIALAQHLAPPSPRSYIVEKAARYMNARLADPLQMSDICDAIRVSSRTLRYSFEEMIGVSPTQYLMAVRLSRVRRDLLQAGASGRINRIAERYGFVHMGRFAQFYCDAFGELPSDTSRRATTTS